MKLKNVRVKYALVNLQGEIILDPTSRDVCESEPMVYAGLAKAKNKRIAYCAMEHIDLSAVRIRYIMTGIVRERRST